jgi:hypothetical protein
VNGAIPVVAEQSLHRGLKLARYQDEVSVEHAQDIEQCVISRHDLAGLDGRNVPLCESGFLGEFLLAPALGFARFSDSAPEVIRKAS